MVFLSDCGEIIRSYAADRLVNLTDLPFCFISRREIPVASLAISANALLMISSEYHAAYFIYRSLSILHTKILWPDICYLTCSHDMKTIT